MLYCIKKGTMSQYEVCWLTRTLKNLKSIDYFEIFSLNPCLSSMKILLFNIVTQSLMLN